MGSPLSKLVFVELADCLRNGQERDVAEFCAEYHGADLRDFYSEIPEDLRPAFIAALEPDQRVELFQYLDIEEQTWLLERMDLPVRRAVLNGLSTDDRAGLLDALPEEVSRRLLEELNPEERKETLEVLSQDKATAGRLMTTEFLQVRPRDTLSQALERVRADVGHVETIYVIYVVDEAGRLSGVLSLRDVLSHPLTSLVEEVMTVDLKTVQPATDQEELANIGKEYDLIAVPVVDENGVMLGIVTFDDIQDVVEVEASEDILRMHGVAGTMGEYFEASLLVKYRQRMVILAGLAAVSVASVILQGIYNSVIERISILAIFLTLLAGSSGNCGTQVAGIIIRAQTVGDFDRESMRNLLWREVLVGLLMAATMAGGLALLAWGILKWSPGLSEGNALGGHTPAAIGMAVGLAMFVALATINVMGGLMPLLMARLKLDPALTAGPFITTTADILTVLIYFNVAAVLLA